MNEGHPEAVLQGIEHCDDRCMGLQYCIDEPLSLTVL